MQFIFENYSRHDYSSFGPFFWSVKGIQWIMINFRWIWLFLKVNTAKDWIRKEQEIMQIESGSFENEALVKNTTFGLQIGVSRNSDLRPKHSDPAKYGKLKPPKKIWLENSDKHL